MAISPIETLKVRSEYLAVRGGVRASVPSCLIEARQRAAVDPTSGEPGGPRFGFTVTKKLGNAVRRNRIRRRLKAAISELAPAKAQRGFDYVVVARMAAFDRAYSDVIADVGRAFAILHSGQHSGKGTKPPSRAKNEHGKASP